MRSIEDRSGWVLNAVVVTSAVWRFHTVFARVITDGTLRAVTGLLITVDGLHQALCFTANVRACRWTVRLHGCGAVFGNKWRLAFWNMITSWRGNLFRITASLWGDTTGIPSQRVLWSFLCCQAQQDVEEIVDLPMILRRQDTHVTSFQCQISVLAFTDKAL